MPCRAAAFAIEITFRAGPGPELEQADELCPRSQVHAVDANQLTACGLAGRTMFHLDRPWQDYSRQQQCPRCRAVVESRTGADSSG